MAKKTSATWQWLVSKAGLPTLIGALALLASVAFNILQLAVNEEQGDRLKESYRRAGTFQSGDLLEDLTRQCKWNGEHEDDDPPPLKIVADFAAYGVYSHPEEFDEYRDQIRRRADNGRNTVRAIFLTRDRREEVLKLQFKGFDSYKRTGPNQEKLERFMARAEAREALTELGLEARALKAEDLTLDEWAQIVLAVDDKVVEQLRAWGVEVLFYPHLLTVHMWSGHQDEALMAIVDFEGAVNETGFIGRGSISDHIRNIFEIIEKGSSAGTRAAAPAEALAG